MNHGGIKLCDTDGSAQNNSDVSSDIVNGPASGHRRRGNLFVARQHADGFSPAQIILPVISLASSLAK